MSSRAGTSSWSSAASACDALAKSSSSVMARAYADTVEAMPIHYEGRDHVVTITIDRPARRNALDLEHFDALADAWKRFRDDDDAWVAIVTGVDDAFCAGGDLRDYLPLLTEALASGSPDDRAR